MEAILQFILSNIASGSMGHYISKALGKIDKEIPLLIDKNADLDEIENLVTRKSLENQIIQLFEEISEKLNQEKTSNVVNFSGGTNTGVVANKVEIKNIKKNVTLSPPEGAIASSLIHRNYSKYLIDRYHEFKKAEIGKQKMNYVVFYNAIKREFGCKWDMVAVSRFSELCTFLQRRIDKTVLGKNRKAKHVKNYSSFEEYIAKHSG